MVICSSLACSPWKCHISVSFVFYREKIQLDEVSFILIFLSILFSLVFFSCLVHRPRYSARLMRFGSRGPSGVFFSDTPPKCLERDCMGRRLTGTRHGNVYRSVKEKQGIVVYRQRLLQTVASLRVVSLVLRGHNLLKISNINPQQEARFSLWKKLVPRESGGNGA